MQKMNEESPKHYWNSLCDCGRKATKNSIFCKKCLDEVKKYNKQVIKKRDKQAGMV